MHGQKNIKLLEINAHQGSCSHSENNRNSLSKRTAETFIVKRGGTYDSRCKILSTAATFLNIYIC